jgi:hypothetical protein
MQADGMLSYLADVELCDDVDALPAYAKEDKWPALFEVTCWLGIKP